MTYCFGPAGDMDIAFSPSFEFFAGTPYESCKEGAKLVFQLLCHAVYQIQSMEEDDWSLLKIEDVSNWEYPDAKVLQGEVILGSCQLITRQLFLARYQIMVKDHVVFALRESLEHEFLIEYFEPESNEWIDQVLDYASACSKIFRRL